MQIERWRDDLASAGYTVDGVLERIGAEGQAGFARNSTIPAQMALAGDMDPLAVLIRLFLCQQPVALGPARSALDVTGMAEARILDVEEEQVRAALDIRPYESSDDGASGFLVSDLTPGLDTSFVPTRPDYVLGASPASLTLTQMTVRRPAGRALDLGTGCGVQSLHLARHCDQVVATDLNPRALELAALTAALNRVDVDLRFGSLYEPVAGERFDLIVSNPPYVMSPPAAEGERLVYREGDHRADGLVAEVVRGAAAHLNPGGTAQFLVNWAVRRGEDWAERISSWVAGTGLDCWAIERERMDRFAYIELWLNDAGLAGSSRWRPEYERWLAYFDELGVEEVGMGWILLTAAGREQPDFRAEAWPHAVQQPVGEVFADDRAAVDAAAMPTDVLLASRPELAADVVQETFGSPLATDPEHIVLRQRRGLMRAIAPGTAETAVIGALDGSMSVAEVIGAVASLLDLDPVDLAARMVPLLREALRDQFLRLPHREVG